MNRKLFKDKEFFTTLVRIATPIAIQNLIASSLNMVDTVMVGQLGETQIAAVGLANQYFFLLNLLLFGVSGGASIFTAQYWGKKDIKNIRRVLGLSLISGVFASFIFTLGALFAPEYVLRIFSKDTMVIELGAQYLRIVGFSYVITAITFSYAFSLRSTEDAKLPMYVSALALSINTVFNYLLIFGKFGFPALGVRGAAIATVLSRVVEVITLLVVTYKGQYVPAAKIKEMLDLSKDFIKRFYKTTIPVILNESIWSLGVTMYAIVYARMGTGVIASINIASTIERVAFVLFSGMGNACAVMLGNRIGANDEDRAFDYAKRFAILGPSIGVLIGTLLIISSPWVLSIFHVSYDVREATQKILMIMSFATPLRVFNLINIVGILRSGGDTKYSLFIDTFGVWFIAAPLAFLGGLVWKLPIQWVYSLVIFEELFKFTFGVKRLISKKWLHNLVNYGDV